MKILGTCLGIGALSSLLLLLVFLPSAPFTAKIAAFGAGCWGIGTMTTIVLRRMNDVL